LLAKFLLHEEIPPNRWLGIALIVAGVGFVTSGPSLTSHDDHDQLETSAIGRSVAGDD